MKDDGAETFNGDVVAEWDAEGETSIVRIQRKLEPRGVVTLKPVTAKGRAVLKSMYRAAARNPGITGPLGYEMGGQGSGQVMVPREGCSWCRSFLRLREAKVQGLAPGGWEALWTSTTAKAASGKPAEVGEA